MPQRTQILLGLLLVLVLSLTFSPLRCPASERSQKDNESGSPPAAAPEDLSDLARHLNNPVGPCATYNGKIGGHPVGLNVRYYNELKVINRADGQALIGTLSFGF